MNQSKQQSYKIKQTEKKSDRFNRLDLALLLAWFTIGMVLRFTNLSAKPASSIEIATLGFSLGHSFTQIPLDQLISEATLLTPLQLDATINSADVIQRLFTESTHPPLYFWLTHWWIKLFTADGELVSLGIGRSLSAIFGGLAIPAIFGLSWLTFCPSEPNQVNKNHQQHRLISHLAAGLMAFSPYGIYLAQEARHYTLSILWIIASLSCMIVAIKQIYHHRSIPWWISPLWIIINSLGIATHYFFALALVVEGLVIVGFGFWQHQTAKKFNWHDWLPIIMAGLGSLAGSLVWLPIASNISSNELTDWIATGYDLDEIWQPIPRLFAWMITMVILLPFEGVPTAIAIASGIIALLALIWAIPALIQGYKLLLTHNSPFQSFALALLTAYGIAAIFIYLLLVYGYGRDISLAARYHFIYFPGGILILAAILAKLWSTSSLTKLINHQYRWLYGAGKRVVIIVLLMSFFGSLTVINNFGYQKSRQANRLVKHIQARANVPIIVVTTYETLSELRELIAFAFAWEQNSSLTTKPAQFLLLERNENHDAKLNAILAMQSKPLELWGVNLRDNEAALNQINCLKDHEAKLPNSGYKNRVYYCK